MELEWLLLLSVGLASGLLGGMLGIGGGVIIVPALILIFEASGQHPAAHITVIAVATSMACIVLTSASAAYTQYRAGKVLWPVFRQMTPVFVLGSLSAGFLIPYLPPQMLRLFIGLFLLLVAIIMLTRWTPSRHRGLPSALPLAGIGYSGGLMSGTAGIAGGNIIVPTLVYFNVAMHNATATSSAMGVLIALAGASGYALGVNGDAAGGGWMLGYIDLRSWLAITIAAIVGAPIGVKLAHRVAAARLKQIFASVLLLVAARMTFSSFFM